MLSWFLLLFTKWPSGGRCICIGQIKTNCTQVTLVSLRKLCISKWSLLNSRCNSFSVASQKYDFYLISLLQNILWLSAKREGVTFLYRESRNHVFDPHTSQSIFVTLDHKTSLKSLGYIYSNSQQYIVWVKMIHFSFMPKIIRTLSKDHVSWRYFGNVLL